MHPAISLSLGCVSTAVAIASITAGLPWWVAVINGIAGIWNLAAGIAALQDR